MPNRPPKQPKKLKDLFRERLVRTHKAKNALLRMKSKDLNQDSGEFNRLDQLVPTSPDIKVEDPKLKTKIISNMIAELANTNGNLQTQIQACQVRIAANNLTIEALQQRAHREGLELKFTMQGSPDEPITPADEVVPNNDPESPEVAVNVVDFQPGADPVAGQN